VCLVRTTRSLLCSAGEIIVLQVKGEVDLGALPILQAALGDSLDRHPAHLIVDLARMTFCSAGGPDLLTHSRYSTAEKQPATPSSAACHPRSTTSGPSSGMVISRFATAAPQRP
jgi:hypothetical protein